MKTEAASRGLWAARLEVVAELASLINTTFDLEEIFRRAIPQIRRVLGFRRASVVLVSEDRRHYYLHTLYDAALGGFTKGDGAYPIERGLTGKAISTGEAIRVAAFSGTHGIRTSGEGNVSALIVPIYLDDEVIGTLNFGAKESEQYEEEDLELAVLLGRQIATSLHYSKLLATIEEQRRALVAEHARVESQRARLEALIDASDAAVMMVSENRIAHANRALGELLGLPLEVIKGAPLDDVNRVLSRSVADPETLGVQLAALEGDGTLNDRVEFHFPRRLVCQRTVAMVRGRDGEALGHLVIYRDVTKEAEAEAAKSEFVSLVSHELRTPLTSIKTSLNLVLRGAAGVISERLQDLLDIALRNLDRLIRLVDDLLDLSRIESGRVVMNIAAVDVNDAAKRAVDAVRAFAQEREVSIEVVEPDSDTVVAADADRLQQVIVNLVSNAIKFSPAGGRVRLRWRKEGDDAVIEVSDEGPGIPSDQLDAIFDKFRQLEQSATRKHGGAGLGLTISRTIVDQLGGQLWAESEEGRGASFFVRLVLAEREPERAKAAPQVAAGTGTVLLVEKDPDLRLLFQTQFEEEGWKVITVSRGEEALVQVGSGQADLIVVGMALADMHGLEFLEQLRDLAASVNTPALLVGPGGDSAQAVAYGADGWLAGDDGLIAEASRLLEGPRRRVVLLIEDDPAVRTGLARGLRRSGYACLQAASGETGLDIARSRVPDVVLTDLQIPGMDGLSVLREMRADSMLADVPAIVVSGHVTPETAKAIASLHAEFLPKPFGTSVVIQEIDRLLGSASD